MFGRKEKDKDARIKELENLNEKLNEQYYDIFKKMCEIEISNKRLIATNDGLKHELEAIRPVVKATGFKPVVSDKCVHCDWAYFSKHDGKLLGCAKDVVCADFINSKNRKGDQNDGEVVERVWKKSC